MAINIDTILKTKIDKSGITELKQEIQNLKKMTANDLIKTGSAKNLDEANIKLKSIKESVFQVEKALNQAFNIKMNSTDLVKLNNILQKLDLKTISRDFNNMGAIGQNAFNKIAAEALTVNTQVKETSK